MGILILKICITFYPFFYNLCNKMCKKYKWQFKPQKYPNNFNFLQ